MPICPKCYGSALDEDAFCERCGEPLKEGVQRREVQPRVVIGPSAQGAKHIRSARIAIMFVAVVTIAASVFFWFQLQREIGKIQSDPMMMLVDDVVALQKVAIASTFFIGLLYIGLFFWAKKNPFGASLTALIIYLTSILVSAAMEPQTLIHGIIIKIIIIVALVRGVQAGLAHRRLGPGIDGVGHHGA